jgi:hypothetical protein
VTRRIDWWQLAGWCLLAVGVGIVVVSCWLFARWQPGYAALVASWVVVASLSSAITGRNLRAELEAARARLDAYNGSSSHEDLADPGVALTPARGTVVGDDLDPEPFMADSQRCPTCKGTEVVPVTGNGSDGFDRCPDCTPAQPDRDVSEVRSLPKGRWH